MSIKENIKNKRVLFIPVFSTRSYKTGEYNLALDGNMARIISKILSAAPSFSEVLIPDNSINLNVWLNALSRNGFHQRVRFTKCNAYGENAHETRMNGSKFENWLRYNIDPLDFDVMVVEPNTLALGMEDHIPGFVDDLSRIIYWCVASATTKGTPWFTEDFVEMDKRIAAKYPTACASYSQVEFLDDLAFIDGEFYVAKYFDFKTIFFPFRLSDKNYQAELVKNVIYKLKEMGYNNFKVLYTDVNDSGLFPEDDTFVRVSGQKEVYLSILKSRPIIPYMEDADMLMHININEFMYYGCRVIMKKNDTIKCDRFHYIESENGLLDALIEELEKGE